MDSRYTYKIEHWQFHKGDIGGIWEALRETPKGSAEDALQWDAVTVPHCFNAKDALDPETSYYQGPCWYRTQISIGNPFQNGDTYMLFEGTGQITEVYLDQQHIHTHEGGYDEWTVALTPYLSEPNRNHTISIRCDNSRNLETIPSDLADFTIYGGLYRTVSLVYEPKIYVDQIHVLPVYDYHTHNGDIKVSGRLNTSIITVNMTIQIIDDTDTQLIEKSISSTNGKFCTSFTLASVEPWSPDTPTLYKCTVGWEVEGQYTTRDEWFGFRCFEFKEHGPFLLNGKRLLLKGTHRHEDHAGVGAAQTSNSITEEMHLIKAMGANFIRLGHYQQRREVLDLCDILGILVWEEIPWCRGGLGGYPYREMGKRMLKNMIEQHYNHPSVIIWGLGNEIDWPGDFPSYEAKKIRMYLQELNTLAHTLDPNRKTAIRRCEFCKDVVDVYSPSIWAGWYRGHYREYKKSTISHCKDVAHFLHVEWGADSHANRFSEDPYRGLENLATGTGTDERDNDASLFGGIARASKDGNWSENYACDLFDWTLKEQLTMPDLTGSAFWPFKDFATPLRKDNPIPYVNQKGVVQRDLTKKETYYVVQSYWSDNPMVRLFGHGWTIRWGSEGEQKEFRAYSNCPRAELFLDGRSLGERERNTEDFPAAGLRWNAELTAGSHAIVVKAYYGNEVFEDGYNFMYQSEQWGKPAAIRSQFRASDQHTILWEIEVVDSQNRRCLDFDKRVYFSAAGNSPLITEMGTATGSRIIECANGRASIALQNINTPSVLAAWIKGLPLCFEQYPTRE
nr:glycoside hydrolase family 2 TIM barrel-domain containing protein [uncultured Sphaerochaeta sp.]